ncbi:MAG: amidohydrolase family protein [Gammaproteobacteria bacterium]|nr:amidohydrolase family protein [Gammaproteobacteria bacterium]NNC97920.1 amidohydrolase family protein [Gammaproteobacteria bacterium]NNM14282.1 amidohydrolase family protein [Gammaproteobacteria bacterium]
MNNISIKNPIRVFLAGFLIVLSGALNAELIAIKGATIYTQNDQGILKNATLIIEDGEITAMGKGARIPGSATIIEADGKIVTPGLIDPYSYLGLEEISLEANTVDKRTENKKHGAGFDVTSAVNPYSTVIMTNRIEGITHAIAAPSNGHSVFAGQAAAIHLGSAKDAETVIKPRVAMFASVTGWTATLAGGSRASAMLDIREALLDAQAYADNQADYDKAAMRELSGSRLDMQALQAVLNADIPLIVNVSRASEIRQALKLVKDFGVRLILAGAQEAWMLADEIAAADAAVILDPLANLPSSFESLGSRLDNAALLHKAGVSILIGDGDSHNSRNQKQLAGNAVANGLPMTAALDAISKNVANAYGLDGLGELNVGDKASLVLWDGDPLEVTTYADVVFIEGQNIAMQSRSTLLRDRYLQKSDLPRAFVKPQ